ncbi:MAG: LytTR family transcriptional regulator [Bacteroidales bacterium]|nr:LytTR family transcriptional regulator [Bacteroidales bacterium]
MKTVGRIAYWLAAIVVLAAILVSLDYTMVQAVLVSLLFCPCALALEFFMPKARKPIDKIYLSLAVLVSVILLIIVLHYCVLYGITSDKYIVDKKDIPPMLINPAFLGLILTALSFGDFLWARWLSRRFKEQDRTVTFFSDRQRVTLKVADIAYVESNDTEVRIVTADGGSYRNKTGITQWENLLGQGFLRIHRSYLVNVASARLSSPDTVTVGDARLPVSRKYKESVTSVLNGQLIL